MGLREVMKMVGWVHQEPTNEVGGDKRTQIVGLANSFRHKVDHILGEGATRYFTIDEEPGYFRSGKLVPFYQELKAPIDVTVTREAERVAIVVESEGVRIGVRLKGNIAYLGTKTTPSRGSPTYVHDPLDRQRWWLSFGNDLAGFVRKNAPRQSSNNPPRA